MKALPCCLCQETGYDVVYNGPIREGQFPNVTSTEHQVVSCSGCGLVRLKDDPNSADFYQSEEYRNTYNDTAAAEDYIAVHDEEQPPRVNDIGISAFRNKKVLDMGCGGGAFLDQISGVTAQTYAVEPFTGYHGSLKERGHTVFASAEEAFAPLQDQIETMVSFGVIEHVEDPLAFLQSAYQLLQPGGTMYMETDNLNDVLMQLGISDFEPFFYRTAHLWYFDQQTLVALAKKAGFKDIEVSFRHNFDLSNVLNWAIHKKPTGNGKLELLDNRINSVWRDFVIEKGLADLICLKMQK